MNIAKMPRNFISPKEYKEVKIKKEETTLNRQ